MKKISLILLITLLSISLVGCQTETGTETKTNTTEVKEVEEKENKKSKPKKMKSDKIYGVGEEAFVLDENREKMYSLKINGVKTDNDFVFKEDLPEPNQKQVIEVDYTYENIAKGDEAGLYIDDVAFQVVDVTGEVSQPSLVSGGELIKQYPQEINPGTSCTAQAHYGLANESDKVKIIFESGMYDTILTFEVPVE